VPALRWIPVQARRPFVGGRSLAAYLALLAIAIQAFVVQTHMHFDWGRSTTSLASILAAPQSVYDPSTLPSGDVDHCLICQAQVSGGRLDTISQADLIVLPTSVAAALSIEALCAAFVISSHSWQGRAPPIA
jgi:hypothetical protein